MIERVVGSSELEDQNGSKDLFGPFNRNLSMFNATPVTRRRELELRVLPVSSQDGHIDESEPPGPARDEGAHSHSRARMWNHMGGAGWGGYGTVADHGILLGC